MNFFSEGLLESPAGRAAALGVGVLFGFWLERAGFGSSRKLSAIFYRRDFAVLKVMFTAIATAALGVHVFGRFGVVAPEALHRLETFLWPQIVGGLVFGVGFVLGGWCPGTALVGAVSGKGDALVFLGGAAAGSALFAATWPQLKDFAAAGARGVLTLPQALGFSEGATVALVVGVALSAFALVGRLTARRAVAP